MFVYLIDMVVLIITAKVVRSDFRDREVDLWALLLLGVAIFTRSVLIDQWCLVLYNMVFNVVLLAIMSVGITTYLRIRMRKIVNPLKDHIGVGDLIFILSLIPIWDTKHFTIFLIVGLMGSMLYWLIRRPDTIPLVGTLGIALCGYILAEFCISLMLQKSSY